MEEANLVHRRTWLLVRTNAVLIKRADSEVGQFSTPLTQKITHPDPGPRGHGPDPGQAEPL